MNSAEFVRGEKEKAFASFIPLKENLKDHHDTCPSIHPSLECASNSEFACNSISRMRLNRNNHQSDGE